MRKICVVTGSRAEYGLLRWVMDGIRVAHDLTLQVIATGMHLAPEFGLTYREIEADGFVIDRKVEMLLSSDSPVGIGKSIGLGMIGFADAIQQLRPDIMVVLGDRFETFAAASAAMVARLPIAHLHGGEATEGAIDESIRHSITKMAQLHFVAAEEYRRRVIQLGEDSNRVFLVGGLGVDSIKRLHAISRADLEHRLSFKFRERNLVVTFHPVTLEVASAQRQLDELLAALSEYQDIGLLFTMPNADTEGRALFSMIEDFSKTRPNAKAYTSLGSTLYLSALSQVDGVVGNSSSGLTEAPSFRIGTIDIGDRQRGRLKADSVISCQPIKESIMAAISEMYSPAFQDRLKSVVNPYGDGGAADRIVNVLATISLDGILKKQFHDLVVS